jgi:hypothetical protein
MESLYTHLRDVWHVPDFKGTPTRPKFDFSGIPLDFDQATHFINAAYRPVLAGEITHSGEPIVHIFDSQESFQDWALKTRFAEHFHKIERIIERIRQQAQSEGRVVPAEKFQKVNVATNVQTKYDWLFSVEPKQLSDDSHVTLYSEESFQGEQAVLGCSALEDLRDIDFYQRARSVSVHGVCLLTDDILFGGFRFYIIGDPYVSIENLHQWHFDRAAASAIIV